MNLGKRAVESIVVASLLVVMCTIAQTAQSVVVKAASVSVNTEADLAATGTAGVIAYLYQIELDGIEGVETAGVEQASMPIVTAAEETLTEEERVWQNRLMANVNEFLYVRAYGDESAEIVGKLYKGDIAEIVEAGEAWTHIVSGNVDGYVKNEYCIFGLDAMNYASANFETEAEIQTNGLRVRSSANIDSPIITAVSTGTTLTVDTSVETDGQWVAVKYGDGTGYVSAEYVTTGLALGKGVTVAEEAAAKAAEEEAARAAAKAVEEAAAVQAAATVQNEPVAASVDEVTLLAAIIECEAGNQPYEGQLAVGAVVMNRVRSGIYPGSVHDVIYQSGQFPPASNGLVANVLSRGPKASCVQAAQEALGGADNTGGATRFSRVSSGRAGVVIGGHVFF